MEQCCVLIPAGTIRVTAVGEVGDGGWCRCQQRTGLCH